MESSAGCHGKAEGLPSCHGCCLRAFAHVPIAWSESSSLHWPQALLPHFTHVCSNVTFSSILSYDLLSSHPVSFSCVPFITI